MSRIVFMATPAFALPALDALLASGYDVVAVYTQPDKPAGRGREVTPSLVKKRAESRGLAVFQPQTFKSPQAVQELAALKPDAIVVAAYGKLLPKAVLDIPPFGCLNIHPSLLPRYRGPSPIAAAILAGDPMTGVTIILLDPGMDSGPILAQSTVAIEAGDNGATLGEKLAREGARLLVETMGEWLAGRIKPHPQDGSQATYCKKIEKEDGLVDWARPAEQIFRQVRAFQPWPGCHTTWKGKALKVLEAAPVDGDGGEPGTVVPLGLIAARKLPPGTAVAVTTGEKLLALAKVQLEGRRPGTSAEFVLGHRDFVGSRLPS